jgi:anti-sigma regulatory factor (Ser/Thr protein kinase)
VSAWLARAYLRHWLELANWPGEQLAAIEHAAAEAVSNAVEHAYSPGAQGVVRITMMIDILDGGQTRQARVIVRDRGRWRGNPGNAQRLGQGIHRMTCLVDTATIHRGGYDNDHGTEVVLLSVPVAVSEKESPQRKREPAAGAGLDSLYRAKTRCRSLTRCFTGRARLLAGIR